MSILKKHSRRHREPQGMKRRTRISALLIFGAMALGGPGSGWGQSPVTISSLTSTTNGVRVSWAEAGAGQAYTVQIRESVTSGAWRNAVTRYRWPWTRNVWADPPRSLPASRYYRVVSTNIPAAQRGKLLSTFLRNQNDTNSIQAFLDSAGVSDFLRAKYGTAARPFTYETIDPFGQPITASALLVVPRGTTGPLPLVSVQHGTMAMKTDAPSQTGDAWAVAFATTGYAVVVPDYLGLGSSPGYQAFLHARGEATCVVDALRAARAVCASNNVSLNGQLFLTGYSQGGHVTLATQRELEARHADEFTITASAPCAGTYDLGGVTTESILAHHPSPANYSFPMLLASYLPIYHLADTLEEILAEPYRRTLPPLLDGAHTEDQLNAAMPADPIAVLRADYQADFRTNATHSLRQALLDNNTLAWTPQAPLTLFHCQGDPVAIFANAEVAYQSFTQRGACCVTLTDPGAPASLDHDACYVPSLRGVFTWFESLRR